MVWRARGYLATPGQTAAQTDLMTVLILLKAGRSNISLEPCEAALNAGFGR